MDPKEPPESLHAEASRFSTAYCAPFNISKPVPLFHTPETRTHSGSMFLDREGSNLFMLSVTEPESLVDSLFPPGVIFDKHFDVQHFLGFLQAEKHTVFKSGSTAATDWREWDIFETMTHPKQEVAVKDFFQNITQLAEIRQLTQMETPSARRYWSSANKDQPARGGDVNRKPDLVCTDSTIGVSDDWRHFCSVVEIKSGGLTPRSVYLLLQERAAVIFRHQDRRRFVLTFALMKHDMTIALFDRGGSVISQPFNIIHHPLLFLKVVLGLSFASEDYLGYDTTIIARPSFRIIDSRFIGRIMIHCTLFIADRMHGRGTIIWLAVLEGGMLTTALPKLVQSHLGWSSSSHHMPLPLVVKDAWVDEKNSVTEGMILALLNHKGVKGVPHIIAEERVSAPVPVGWTEEASYPSDSTTLNRSRLRLPPGQLRLNEPASKAEAAPDVMGYDPRAHVRSYMTPYAISIFEFRSGVELLGIIADVLTSHEQATLDYRTSSHESSTTTPSSFPFRILHRDLSSRNVGMVPHDKSDHIACPLRTKGEHRGLLYDWGCAAIADVGAADRPAAVEEVDTDIITDEGYILLPTESDADSGLFTATPEFIDGFDDLVELVRRCMHEEHPGLEITGTLPFMSIEMLEASLSLDRANQDNEPTTPMHEIRHDLEASFMVLVSLCLLFEEPHRPKNVCRTSDPLPRPHEVLSAGIIAWLTAQESYDENVLRDRFVTFGTRLGFSSKILTCLSPYFEPMGPYLEKIRQLIYGDHEWPRGRYQRPPTSPSHKEFIEILHSAMKEIPFNSPGFSEISDPPDFYLPISPSGVWQGGEFDWRNPIIRSNNAFGYFRSRRKATLESVTIPPTPTTDGFLVVDPSTPAYTFVNSGPETFSNPPRNRYTLSGTRPSDLYPTLPSVKRPGSTTRRPKKKQHKTRKPLSAYSTGALPVLPMARLRKRRGQYRKGRLNEVQGVD